MHVVFRGRVQNPCVPLARSFVQDSGRCFHLSFFLSRVSNNRLNICLKYSCNLHTWIRILSAVKSCKPAGDYQS